MSGNIAVIYAGDVEPVAEAFADAAAHLATGVRLLRLYGEWIRPTGNARQPHLADLEWANGIPFGTPIGPGRPAPELMEFIDGTDPVMAQRQAVRQSRDSVHRRTRALRARLAVMLGEPRGRAWPTASAAPSPPGRSSSDASHRGGRRS